MVFYTISGGNEDHHKVEHDDKQLPISVGGCQKYQGHGRQIGSGERGTQRSEHSTMCKELREGSPL